MLLSKIWLVSLHQSEETDTEHLESIGGNGGETLNTLRVRLVKAIQSGLSTYINEFFYHTTLTCIVSMGHQYQSHNRRRRHELQ
jgi:hypothetical protein